MKTNTKTEGKTSTECVGNENTLTKQEAKYLFLRMPNMWNYDSSTEEGKFYDALSAKLHEIGYEEDNN